MYLFQGWTHRFDREACGLVLVDRPNESQLSVPLLTNTPEDDDPPLVMTSFMN